jgi:serine/threonine protein kinase
MKEIGVLRRLSHKNIIRLHAVYEKDEHIFLVEDLLGGGNIL